jgi:hypothetical protein
MIDPIALTFDTIRDYLAAVPRDPLLSLSAQILRDAAEYELARRIVAAGAFNTPASKRYLARKLPDAGETPAISSMALAGKNLALEHAAATRRRNRAASPKKPKRPTPRF